jgi:hypothetical protein
MGNVKKYKRLLARNGDVTKTGDKNTLPSTSVTRQEPSSFLETDPQFMRMAFDLKIIALKRGVTLKELTDWIHKRYGVWSMKKLTLQQYKELKIIVRSLPKVIQ